MHETCVAHITDNGGVDADALVAGETRPIVVLTRSATRLVVFNRSEARNALTRDMRRAFAALLAEAEGDDSVHAIIITGAHGVFCAGVDIKESRAQSAPMVRPHPGEALRALKKPVIAAVEGACVTGGLEIALSCSFIVASERASFADTHAKAGVFPAWGLTAMLPRAIGMRRARQMMMTGAPIDAATAHQWGLVNELITAPDLLSRCFAIAHAATSADQRLVRREMELLDRYDDASFQQAIAAEEAAALAWRESKSN